MLGFSSLSGSWRLTSGSLWTWNWICCFRAVAILVSQICFTLWPLEVLQEGHRVQRLFLLSSGRTCGSMMQPLFRMQKVPGSIPFISIEQSSGNRRCEKPYPRPREPLPVRVDNIDLMEHCSILRQLHVPPQHWHSESFWIWKFNLVTMASSRWFHCPGRICLIPYGSEVGTYEMLGTVHIQASETSAGTEKKNDSGQFAIWDSGYWN